MNSVKSSALKVNNRVILERLLKVGLKFKYNKRHEIHHRVERLFQPLTVAPRGSVHHKNDDTSNSHKLMLDYGIIHSSSTGMFHYLPLGLRILEKLVRLIDNEMSRIGAQKIEMPCMIPKQLLQNTERWDAWEPYLFKVKDKQNKEYCLGPTHEEPVTLIMSSINHLSYKELPILLYQMTHKYRDEGRPKRGLQRAREFLMKDLYSFDASEERAKNTYDILCSSYESILNRLNMKYFKVQADSGTIGGSYSHEFHIPNTKGDDHIVICPSCKYGSNVEVHGSNQAQCPQCNSNLENHVAVEVGHTFLLGTRYSKPLNAVFMNAMETKQYLEMGCYGLGVSRIIASAADVMSTADELRWPRIIAPYQICIIPPKDGSKEAEARTMAMHLYQELSSNELFPNDVIFDGRGHLTIGHRLLQAKRTGYPYVVITGKKVLETIPKVEVHDIYNATTFYLTHNELFNFFKSIKQSISF